MAKVIPAATASFGGPLASATSMSTDTLPTGGGGTLLPANSNATDTALAITVTGRRFQFEARILNSGNNNTTGMGIAWTSTLRTLQFEIEYSGGNAGGTVVPSITRYSTAGTNGTNQAQPSTAYTSPAYTVASNVYSGPFICRGWIDYATSGTYTLTPFYFTGSTALAYYARVFRVDTWLA
jgi:hypothetical protein